VLVVTDAYSAAAVRTVMRLAKAPREPRGTWIDFLTGSGVAVVNVSLGVLMIVLIDADWRAAWARAVLPLAVSLGYRSHVELRRRHQSLEKLVGFTEDVNLDMGTDVVGGEVVTRAAQLVDADVVELTWRGAGAPELQVARRSGRATVPAPPLAARFGALGARPVVARRQPRDAVLRAQLEAADLRDAIVVPLLVEGEVRGTLLVGDRLGDVATFTDDDVRVLQALANHAAVALANAQLADELRHEAAKRRHEAQHDALTGLGNRQLFLSAVRARTVDDEPLAVLLLDLDRFKDVNDTLGHTIGDLLLGKVAERLLSAVPADALTARLGGDEFGVLLVGAGEVDAAATAHRLRVALSRPHQVGELSLHTSCSIGIAVSPKDGHDAEVLLQRADIAMYAAKAEHTGFHVYSPEGDHYSARRLALVGDLRSALANDGLHVHYQPTVDLTTGAMVGVEALVRWNHDEYGVIAPDEFLPIAEHTDLMLPLTTFVLGTALRDTAAWEAQGLRLDVSVNLSPRVLVEREIPRLVADLLLETGLPAQRLTAEITEHSIISDPARATAVLEELDGMGVGLSVDDFGTGYGSLSYLRRLPVHEVKIDKSFVLEVATADSDAAIVRSTVDGRARAPPWPARGRRGRRDRGDVGRAERHAVRRRTGVPDEPAAAGAGDPRLVAGVAGGRSGAQRRRRPARACGVGAPGRAAARRAVSAGVQTTARLSRGCREKGGLRTATGQEVAGSNPAELTQAAVQGQDVASSPARQATGGARRGSRWNGRYGSGSVPITWRSPSVSSRTVCPYRDSTRPLRLSSPITRVTDWRRAPSRCAIVAWLSFTTASPAGPSSTRSSSR
jgi:diguanylate cyclase (GGDEF)-like protein